MSVATAPTEDLDLATRIDALLEQRIAALLEERAAALSAAPAAVVASVPAGGMMPAMGMVPAANMMGPTPVPVSIAFQLAIPLPDGSQVPGFVAFGPEVAGQPPAAIQALAIQLANTWPLKIYRPRNWQGQGGGWGGGGGGRGY